VEERFVAIILIVVAARKHSSEPTLYITNTKQRSDLIQTKHYGQVGTWSISGQVVRYAERSVICSQACPLAGSLDGVQRSSSETDGFADIAKLRFAQL